MKNNIKEILKLKDMSINELSRLIEKDYATTHALVNRESLNTTSLDTLVKVSDVLGVDIQMLYSEEERRDIRVLRLYNAKYAGGLAVEALIKYKKEVEEGIKEKLERPSVVSYEYKSDITMQGVSDEVSIEIIIGSRRNDEDRYTFYLKTRSAEFIFKSRLVDMIVLTIEEYEKDNFKDIEETWKHLSFEGYNQSDVELIRIIEDK